MSGSTLEHFSHPEHLLILRENDVIGADAKCSVCNKSVLGSPTYTCISHRNTDCENFYLHKSCAELPVQINHPKHNKHPLTLLPAPDSPDWVCDLCFRVVKCAYICDYCEFLVCVFCAIEQRVLDHPGHAEHTLILMQRESLFTCDACYEEAKDNSYVCTTCQFWIHKSCALSPFIIPDPSYHHHPLNLIFSIPDVHRYFQRFCNICSKRIFTNFWMYYCHKCTYFVHMKCATSSHTISIVNEVEADGVDDYPDLVQLPLPSEESLFQLIITQCCKLQVDFQCERESALTMPNDPYIIEEHWSHNHPLEQLQFTISESDGNNDDVDRRLLICDGCVQPITISHPCYYACIQCGFFLHSFCATKLPRELLPGVSPFHPQHSLLLKQRYKFYSFVECGICSYKTNGFYYVCEICDIKIDIRCAFLPTRIRHKSHKHHSLVQRHFLDDMCSVSRVGISNRLGYACETCTSFQISIRCAFYPSKMKHRYDDHSLILRYPPFFYEGVFYCEVCEEQVNNQWVLYHCDDCDHSFHDLCLRSYENVKLGGTIKYNIGNQPHTLALVLKRPSRKNSPPFLCGICGDDYRIQFFFECDGCGYLACIFCVRRIHAGQRI